MTTKAPKEFSLEIKRLIKAPRDCVYEAWTDPAQLKQWFGPENVQTRDLVADARVGGEFRWDLINSEGEKMTMRGKFRELQSRSEEHTSELQSPCNLVCRLLLEKKK